MPREPIKPDFPYQLMRPSICNPCIKGLHQLCHGMGVFNRCVCNHKLTKKKDKIK